MKVGEKIMKLFHDFTYVHGICLVNKCTNSKLNAV